MLARPCGQQGVELVLAVGDHRPRQGEGLEVEGLLGQRGEHDLLPPRKQPPRLLLVLLDDDRGLIPARQLPHQGFDLGAVPVDDHRVRLGGKRRGQPAAGELLDEGRTELVDLHQAAGGVLEAGGLPLEQHRAPLERHRREQVHQEGGEDQGGEDRPVDGPLGERQGGEDEGDLGAAAHAHPDGEGLARRQPHAQGHAPGAEDLSGDHRDREQDHESDRGGADVEGDREPEGDEEDRSEKGVGDSVGAVLDHPYEVGVGDLLLEEQAGEVGAEDHVQADRLGEEAAGDGGQQHEGEPLAPLGAERQRQARVEEAADQERDGEEPGHLAYGEADGGRLQPPARQQAEDEAEEHQGQQVVDDAAGEDEAGDPGVVEPQVLEALEGDDDGGRRADGQPDEGGAEEVEAEQDRHPEADRERHRGPGQGDPEGALQGVEELHRLGLDAGVEHQEEDADLGKQLDRMAGGDQPEDRRPHQHPDDQLPHHRRHPEGAQGDGHEPDAGEQDQQVEGDLVHGVSAACGVRAHAGSGWRPLISAMLRLTAAVSSSRQPGARQEGCSWYSPRP